MDSLLARAAFPVRLLCAFAGKITPGKLLWKIEPAPPSKRLLVAVISSFFPLAPDFLAQRALPWSRSLHNFESLPPPPCLLRRSQEIMVTSQVYPTSALTQGIASEDQLLCTALASQSTRTAQSHGAILYATHGRGWQSRRPDNTSCPLSSAVVAHA